MVHCYPSPGKAKAHMICEAFAQGCGGRVVDPRKGYQGGVSFFYGVVNETRAIFEKAKADGGQWIYCDNAYFDRGRQGYFRVTKNAFQFSRMADPDYKRLDDIGVKVKPWREEGNHIVVCEQSATFMELCGWKGDWLSWVTAKLKSVTSRELRIRKWNRDKAKLMATLKEDLIGAWAVVTHTSASANEALVNGIPAFVTGNCAASPMNCGGIELVDSPLYPAGRSAWAAGLVTQQWTRDEIINGKCWRDLNA